MTGSSVVISTAPTLRAALSMFNALTFAISSVLIAGVNLYALGLVLEGALGWLARHEADAGLEREAH